MKRISARSMTFYKWIFPLLWFGGLATFLFVALTQDIGARGRWPALLVPLVMMVFGFFLMKKLVWDLADEVEDHGDWLLVRKGGEEDRIPLSNIMNVNSVMHMNPPRVTLRLVRPGRFGNEVSFSPVRPFSFKFFPNNPLIDDLIVRVDKARRGRDG